MNKSLPLVLLTVIVALCSIETAQAQPAVTGTNGVLGFNLDSYGRFRLSPSPYSTTGRQIDRMSFVAALSPQYVFDYFEDGDSTSVVADTIAIAGVDTAFICVSDNGDSHRPPKIRVHHTVLSWHNTSYVLIRYQAINDSTIGMVLHLGVAVLPRPSRTYGFETVTYSADRKTAYFFRTGETPHWGFRLLNKEVYSVKIRDWDRYSPADPINDAAHDSTRYAMTVDAISDSSLTAGENGSIFHVNAGPDTLAPGAMAEVYYAVAFGNSVNEVLAASDSAQARFNSFITVVAERPIMAPRSFTLHQNFPNPFNPSTQIRFDLPHSGTVQLKVYDATGREVRTLVNGMLKPGSHVIPFGAAGMSSGVYFYSLRMGSVHETRKMLLMR